MGSPRSWRRCRHNELQPGILFQFWDGTYQVYFTKGSAKNGTTYEVFGRFTLQLDADGLPKGGTGTGEARILHPNRDIDKDVPDSLTFTFSRGPEPAYCSDPVPQ